MRYRFRWVMGMLTAGFAVVLGRLAYVQVWQHEELSRRANEQAQRWVRDAPRRAPICDRHGDVLADSVRVASCYADPRLISQPESLAQTLSGPLHLSSGELARDIRKAPGSFVWVKRPLTADESRWVEERNLLGIGLQWDYRRFYPNGDLAGPVLGRVGEDGRGLSGLEHAFDKDLVDHRPPLKAVRDGRGRRLSMEASRERPSAGGLRLALDRKIQFIAERELDWAMRRSRARTGIVAVQDPWTGEILALAGRPAVSLTSTDSPSPESMMVRASEWTYEPGSTFKIVTAAAALEAKAVRPGELVNCESGRWSCSGVEINDHEPQKIISFARVMEVSSNIGFAKVGLRLGKDKLYDAVRAFGFGSRTGFEVPGESVGILRPPSQWSGVTLPTMSFGQEIGVTVLQLVTAYSAVANGGVLLEPRLCLDAEWPSGEKPRWPLPMEVRRVMSAETADTLTTLLEGVVLRGTGQDAALPGWTVAGKTGTAQKIDPRTRTYSRDKYVASFCGFVPSRRPRLTIAVIIDEPKGIEWGGYNAGPVFKNVAWQVLSMLGVPTEAPPPSHENSQRNKKSR